MDPAILLNALSFGAIGSIILIGMIAFFFGIQIQKTSISRFNIATPVLLSLVLNLLFLLFRVISSSVLISDEKAWHRQAIAVSEYLINNEVIRNGTFGNGKAGYAWIVGALYAIGGQTPVIPIFLNISLYALLIPIFVSISQIICTELGLVPIEIRRVLKFGSYVIAITPTMLFWTPRLLREVPSMFLISLTVLLALKYLKRKRISYLFGMLMTISLMAWIRAEIGVGLAAGLLLGFSVLWSLKLKGIITRVLFVAPLFLLSFFSAWTYADSKGDLSVENTAYRNQALSDANSAFAGSDSLAGASSIFDIVFFNLPRVLFGPFPNELSGSVVMLLAALSNLVWLTGMFLCLRILFRRKELISRRNGNEEAKVVWNGVILLLTLFFTFILMISISAGNYGLVVRMRLMPIVLLIPLASVGFGVWNLKKTKKERSGRPSKVKVP